MTTDDDNELSSCGWMDEDWDIPFAAWNLTYVEVVESLVSIIKQQADIIRKLSH